MGAIDPGQWILALNALPPEALWVAQVLVCFGLLLLFVRLFGAPGACVYLILCVIAANVEVLKVVDFAVMPSPVAMGTVPFAATYLCTDLLTEYYGRAWAIRGVWIGFSGLLTFVVFMFLAMGYTPITPEVATATGNEWALGTQGHLTAVFTPAPIFFISGMAAYLVSQLNDVWLYRLIRRLTADRALYLRNILSTSVSALVDSTIFSLLAWIILNPEPLPLSTVIWTYIIGTWIMRVVLAFLDTPFMYLARRCLPPADRGPLPAELK